MYAIGLLQIQQRIYYGQQIIAQSICTIISNFSDQELLKISTIYFQVQATVFFCLTFFKSHGSCNLKTEEAKMPFFFKNKVLTLFFAPYMHLRPYFSGSQRDQVFQNQNSGCRLSGQMSLICSLIKYMIVDCTLQNTEVQLKSLFYKQYFFSESCIRKRNTSYKIGTLERGPGGQSNSGIWQIS